MILILSNESDQLTNLVISYLGTISLLKQLKRLNINRSEKSFFVLSNFIEDASYIWMRRGNFSLFNIPMPYGLHKERSILIDYLHFLAERKVKCLGSLSKEYKHNKLIDIQIAKEINIKVPDTHIISNKKELVCLLKKFNKKEYITKAIWNQNNFEVDGIQYFGGAPFILPIVKIQHHENETFFPSLVQEKIEKEFEIRIFFVSDKFYSMAIFSQRDEQTRVDFRNFNKSKPNRNIPFLLPKQLKEKLTKFMKTLNLNTGSIDMIYSTKKEFVFLEVNPVGQVGWLSENCNYYIERDIAYYLSN